MEGSGGSGSGSGRGGENHYHNEYAKAFADKFYQNLIREHFGGKENRWLKERIDAGDLQSVHTFLNEHGRRPDLQSGIITRQLRNPDITKGNKKYLGDDDE